MTTYRIFRKESAFLPTKVTKAEAKEIRRRIEGLSRIQRPGITDLFLSGQFAKLPAIPSAVVNNPPLRRLDWNDCAYVIPASDLGKTGEATQVQTLKLWIGKHLSAVVSMDELAIVIDPD